MPEITLHSYRRCPFAIRVRMTLEEKEIIYRTIEEDLSNPSQELLALHPQGLVPLLEHRTPHGRIVLFESSIITEYLDETFEHAPLMPKHAEDRAMARLWTYWCNAIFKVDIDLFKYELKTLSVEDRAALMKRLSKHLDKMEHALSAHSHLAGDRLTLADIHVFPFYRQFTRITPAYPDLTRYRQLNQWLGKLLARPSFQRAMNSSFSSTKPF